MPDAETNQTMMPTEVLQSEYAFDWKFRPRDRTTEEAEDRRITLFVDIGAMEELKNAGLDMVDKPETITQVFQEHGKLAMCLYELSDAHDLDPVKFARGLLGSCLPQATESLRLALLAFFHNRQRINHARILRELAGEMVDTEEAIAEAADRAGISQHIRETLRSEDFVSTLRRNVEDGLKQDVDKMLGDLSTNPLDVAESEDPTES